ncbi:MAG: DUF1700 domain-containing protein [Candidatus Methylarchaceae archaeon HK01M]|nr:DUF1700 domain-containing protein [Candidatus Methylarchaceae archaeon HK01M]
MSKNDKLDELAKYLERQLDETNKSYELLKESFKLYEKDEITSEEYAKKLGVVLSNTLLLSLSSAKLLLELKKEVDKLRYM